MLFHVMSKGILFCVRMLLSARRTRKTVKILDSASSGSLFELLAGSLSPWVVLSLLDRMLLSARRTRKTVKILSSVSSGSLFALLAGSLPLCLSLSAGLSQVCQL